MVVPDDVTWETTKQFQIDVAGVRDRMTPEMYSQDVKNLRKFLCNYVNSESGKDCSGKLGNSINPMGGTPLGGKRFKVRWPIPNAGKSSGLRIALVAYCNEMRVVLAGGWARKNEPSDEEFEAAFNLCP